MDTCILLLVHVLAMLSWLITECLVCWLRPSATLVILDWVLISVSDTDNMLIDIFIIFVQINFSSRLQCFPFSACTCDSSHYIIVLTVIVTQCQRSLFKIIYPVYIFYLQSMFDIFTMQWIWHFLIPCVSSQIYTLVPTHGVLCLLLGEFDVWVLYSGIVQWLRPYQILWSLESCEILCLQSLWLAGSLWWWCSDAELTRTPT